MLIDDGHINYHNVHNVSFNVALCIDSADQTFTLIDNGLVHDYIHGFFYIFVH